MTEANETARFAIVGATGQLGGAYLGVPGIRAAGIGRRQAKLTDESSLEAALGATQPDVVVNASAFNQVDAAEQQKHEAMAVNFQAPALLARICRRNGWKLVHFSSDYVFGREGLTRPYTEQDRPAPLNFYGLSKLMGEQAVLGLNPDALVFRVAHLYGGPAAPDRQNLVLRFLGQAREKRPIWASNRQWLNPTSVTDVVEWSLKLVAAGRSGLYHLSGEGQCTVSEYVAEILRLTNQRTAVVEPGEDARPARRPRYSVLDNERLRAEGFPALPHWHHSLKRYVDALTAEGTGG